MKNPPPPFRGIWADDYQHRCYYSEGAGPYRVIPAAVAVPKDTEDVTTLVSFANEIGVGLVPRGAGSGMPGGNVGSGIVVDMNEFRQPPEFVGERTIRCGAGCTWADVARVAGKRSLRFPPDPASKRFCTVGGMVSNNAAGPRTLKYGSVARWTESLEFVTADGELERLVRHDPTHATRATRRFWTDVAPLLDQHGGAIGECFPKTTKNSSGYALDRFSKTGDLIDILVGSEGTLGLFTEVMFLLDPVPEARATLLATIPDIERLVEAIGLIKRSDPSAIELLDETFLALARENTNLDIEKAAAVLLVDIEGDNPSEVSDRIETVGRELAGIASCTFTGLDDDDSANLWALRHAASPTLARLPGNQRSVQIIEDSCVPLEHLGEYLKRVKLAARVANVEIVAFGHAGDGHLHVNAIVDVEWPDLETRLDRLLVHVTEIVAELGGTMSGEHGDGRLRARSLATIYGPEIVDLFHRVKKSFDPNGILNPGVILPACNPVSDLKIGARAAPIPAPVVDAFRTIEAEASWGQGFPWRS